MVLHRQLRLQSGSGCTRVVRLCGLTLELRGRSQLAARSDHELVSVAWPAGVGPLERLVRRHRGRGTVHFGLFRNDVRDTKRCAVLLRSYIPRACTGRLRALDREADRTPAPENGGPPPQAADRVPKRMAQTHRSASSTGKNTKVAHRMADSRAAEPRPHSLRWREYRGLQAENLVRRRNRKLLRHQGCTRHSLSNSISAQSLKYTHAYSSRRSEASCRT